MSHNKPLPYGKQSISKADVQAVVNVLQSSWLTQGPVLEQFESALCDYTGSQYALAVSSGTAALHLACLALDIGLGDRVWTTPISFVASANCALYCGASVEFVDVDPVTALICPILLTQQLEQAEQKSKLPKAIIVVHFGGFSCDMKTLHELAMRFGFKLIEDACHALGARYQDKAVGSCQYADAVTFSFHPLKSITSGEGGALLTNNEKIWRRAARLRHHGIERNQEDLKNPSTMPGYHEVQRLGFNYRLSDIHAALGCSQLKRLDNFIERRKHLASRYTLAFKDLPIQCPQETAEQASAWHIYVIIVSNPADRECLMRSLREAEITTAIHYIPIYQQPYWQQHGSTATREQAEAYYQRCVTLPLFVELTEDDQDRVIKLIREFYSGNLYK